MANQLDHAFVAVAGVGWIDEVVALVGVDDELGLGRLQHGAHARTQSSAAQGTRRRGRRR